jgi:hypothetical protein
MGSAGFDWVRVTVSITRSSEQFSSILLDSSAIIVLLNKKLESGNGKEALVARGVLPLKT